MRIAQFEASHPVSLKARSSLHPYQHKSVLFALEQYQRFGDLGEDLGSSISP